MSVKPPSRTSCEHSIYYRHRFEWILLGASVVTLAVMLAGCASPIVPVSGIVHVHDNTKVLKAYESGIRHNLTLPCPATYNRAAVATVNDLATSNDQNEAAADCRQNNIDKALKVKAPASGT